MPTTGKWYFEGTVTLRAGDAILGISNSPISSHYIGTASSGEHSYGGVGGAIYPSGTSTGYATYTTGDIISCAFDADNGELYFAKNGAWQASGDPANNSNPSFSGLTGTPYFFGVTAGNTGQWDVNFGQRAFAYTAPSGYKALCTANLPDPTIADGSTAFDAKTFTANNGTQTISGFNFSPDLIWTKSRANAYAHQLWDQVRGTNKALSPNDTSAEANLNNSLAFTSDGFTSGTNNNANYGSGGSIAWAWDAGSSTVTNTDGSISAQVRANPSAGFSIVSYTGTGANATVSHGLNAAPELIIVKNRSTGSFSWPVYHISTGNGNRLYLELTNASSSGTNWNNTTPTSSVFSIGTNPDTSQSTDNFIAYCFAPVEGYSAMGSYTGNGSSDGTFVFTGFRPAFLMVKCTSITGHWLMLDAERNDANLVGNKVASDLSGEENNSSVGAAGLNGFDFLSNGFKARTNTGSSNSSGQTFIYAAFAEHPFKNSRAR